jgi:hypothetical protein
MDFIKKASDSFSNSNKDERKEGDKPAEQKEDYVDKAFAFASDKSGYKIDRNTQEKITDGGRDAYEKYSGNKVDPKISN